MPLVSSLPALAICSVIWDRLRLLADRGPPGLHFNGERLGGAAASGIFDRDRHRVRLMLAIGVAARDAVAAIGGRGNSDRRTAAIAPADAGRERARHVGHAGGHHEARGTAFRGTHTLAARRQHRLDGHREGLTDWTIAIIA